MSDKTKLFIFRIAWALFWIAFCIIGLVNAVRNDSLVLIISRSILIGLWLGLLIDYTVEQIIYLIKKRRMKNVVSEFTEQETEELPF